MVNLSNTSSSKSIYVAVLCSSLCTCRSFVPDQICYSAELASIDQKRTATTVLDCHEERYRMFPSHRFFCPILFFTHSASKAASKHARKKASQQSSKPAS